MFVNADTTKYSAEYAKIPKIYRKSVLEKEVAIQQ